MDAIRVETRLQIGEFEKQWPVFVAPIHEEMLLGTRLLAGSRC